MATNCSAGAVDRNVIALFAISVAVALGVATGGDWAAEVSAPFWPSGGTLVADIKGDSDVSRGGGVTGGGDNDG
jgi:hypothetical protein